MSSGRALPETMRPPAGSRWAPAQRLLWANGLFALANGLSGLFTNVYLWRLKPGMATPAYYNLFIMLTVLVAMPLLGWLVKRYGAVVANVLGTSLYAGFYLALILLRERAAEHLVELGIFMGWALSAYALAGHVLVYDTTEPESREGFLNRNGLVGSVAGLIAPLVAGQIVSRLPELTGYRVIFVTSFLLFAGSAWVSLGLSSRRPPSPYRLGEVLPGSHPGWRRLLLAYGIIGLREGIFSFAVSLLVYLATGGEQSVGNFAFLTAGAGLAAFWLAGRFMTPANRDRLFPVGAVLMGLATGVLGLGATWGVMLAHGLMGALANPVWSTAFNANSFDVIREASGARDLRVEMIAAREVPLNAGRVLSLLLFLQAAPHLTGTRLQALLALLGLVFPIAYLIVRPRAGERSAA
jgi:YQGE family putative transporter